MVHPHRFSRSQASPICFRRAEINAHPKENFHRFALPLFSFDVSPLGSKLLHQVASV
jgi:hypothetical protein